MTATETPALDMAAPGTVHQSLDDAIHGVMLEIDYIQRKQVAGLKYRIITEADVIALVRPALVKHRIVLKPVGVTVVGNDVERVENGDRVQIIRNTKVVYRWKVSHIDSKEHEYIECAGEGTDYADKSLPKSLTIALKYLLRHLFVLETGDDPDNTPAEHYQQAQQQKPAQQQQKPAQTAAAGKPDAFRMAIAALKTATDTGKLEAYIKAARSRPFTVEQHKEVGAVYETRKTELTPPNPDEIPDEPSEKQEAF